MRAEAARMFFVLNKVDYLSENDRQEALAFTRDVLEEALGTEPKLYPVSARQGLFAKLVGDQRELEASGMATFERDFSRFLVREKGSVIVTSISGQGRKLLADARNALDVEERALQIPIEDLAARTEEMERVFAQALESRDDIRTLLRREAEKLVALVEEDLDHLRQNASKSLVRRAEGFLAESPDVPSVDAVDELVKDALRRELERWRLEEDRKIGEAFQIAMSRHVEETNRLIEGTVRLCGELLQVQLSSVDTPAGIAPETQFTYSFFEVPTILESLLPDMSRFLPAGVVRRRVSRTVSEKVPELVDKHCGRLRWDFVQRLDRSRVALEGALDERLEGTIESLRLGVRRALDERSRSETEARSAWAAMEADRRRLEALDAAFALVREQAEAGDAQR